MRRLIVICVGLIVLILIGAGVIFSLKAPEMPIKEVHKAISLSRVQKQTVTPALPTPSSVPVIIPYNSNGQNNPNMQNNNGVSGSQPVGAQAVAPSSLPQPGNVPGNALGNGNGH